MDPPPGDSKPGNNLKTRGNAVLKTFLPDSFKGKAMLPTSTKYKESPISSPECNFPVSEDFAHPASQQKSTADSKPLARVAIVNDMLSKTVVEEETWLLKRGSSGSSEGRRRRTRPHEITHSASDTACNRARGYKKQETKKRRSMSDYLDMKSDKHSFAMKEKETLRKMPGSKNSPTLLKKNSGQFCETTKKEESSKHQMKNKISLLRGKLPTVTTWTSRPNDAQKAEKKLKEGKYEDTAKEKSEVPQNAPKTRKTSTDIIKTAFQKKVNTISGIQSWKLNTFKHRDGVNENLTKTETMLKELMQDPSDTSLENVTTEQIDTTRWKSDTEHEAGPLDHKKVTLSVKKLTPIPSEEYQSDSDVDGNQNLEKETPSSPQCPNSGRGILKKASNVEILNIELIQNPESISKNKEETNNSPSRMVKFDMPSFESQTSEDLPSITIDQYESQEDPIEESQLEENHLLTLDKATETDNNTILDDVEIDNSTEENVVILYDSILPIIQKSQIDKNILCATIRDVLGILENVEEDKLISNLSREDLVIQRSDCLSELKQSLRSILNINKALIENEIVLEDIEKSENEEQPEENVEHVQTFKLVLENIDLSLIDKIKDQNGKHIKPPETPEDSLEKHDQVKELESKVDTQFMNPLLTYNVKNVRKSSSCPELCASSQTELSDKTFAQTFGCKYQEDAGEVERSEAEDSPVSDSSEARVTCKLSEASSVDSLQVDMEMIRNCLFMRETQIVDDFVML